MKTRKLYYEDAYLREFEAEVVEVAEGELTAVALSQTAFYPGGGGQPCDIGLLSGPGWKMNVEEVYEDRGLIFHSGRVEGGRPKVGNSVDGSINWSRRYRLMRMHTAAHILGYVIKKNFGWDVRFAGGALGVEQSYDDFTARILAKDLPILEEQINSIVEKDIPVKIFWLPRKDAEKYIARFHEKLTELHEGIELFRIVEIEGLYAIPCGGTHVKSTGEVKGVKLLKREAKGKGIVRVRYKVID